MCSPGGRSSVKTTASRHKSRREPCGSRPGVRSSSTPPSDLLGVDQLDGLVLCLGGFEFGRPEWRHGPPRQMVASVDPSPWVLPAVFLVALGVATRRIWPRAAFIATVVGVGISGDRVDVRPDLSGTCACRVFNGGWRVDLRGSGTCQAPPAERCHHCAAGHRCSFCSCR